MNKLPFLQKGFSLIEITIVIVIVAIIGTVSLVSIGNVMDNQKLVITKNRLDKIKNAVNNYFLKNKRLPCPADPTLTDVTAGNENTTGTVGCLGINNNTTDSRIFASGTNFVQGAIPVTTLGLANEDLYDGFGRKIDYVVNTAYTPAAGIANIVNVLDSDPRNLTFSAGTACDPTYNASGLAQYSSDTDCIMISASNLNLEVENKTAIVEAGRVAYAVISHGKNGIGAYTKEGQRGQTVSTNSDATLENRHIIPATGIRAGSNKLVNSDPAIGGLDDIIRYGSLYDIIVSQNMNSYVKCPKHTTIQSTDPNPTHNWAETLPNNTISAVYAGPTNHACATQTGDAYQSIYLRTCNSLGVWSDPNKRPC